MRQLIINKLQDPGFLARARSGGHGGGGMDAKRGRAWCEFGYKRELDAEDYQNFWARSGIAYGAVKILLDKCWQDNPVIDDQRFKSLAEDVDLWHNVRMADKYRLASNGWSALLLTIANENYDQPVSKGGATKALVAITPCWSQCVNVAETDENGNPKMYNVAMASGNTVPVHPSRLVFIGCRYTDEPFLRAGYNTGVDLEKILGGSGESYLKNAARQLGINYDSEGEMEELATISGEDVDTKTVRQAINEVVTEMNRGNDAALITQGATVQMLTTSVSDPTGNFDVACSSFAASVGLPIRAIIGNQTGERATTEDNKAVNERCQSRRTNELARDIRNVLNALYEAGCIKGRLTYTWSDLTAMTLLERAETYSTLVMAMMQGNMLEPEQNKKAIEIAGLDFNG